MYPSQAIFLFHRHKGKIIGALSGLVLASFWGCFFGLFAGIAFDEWDRFLLDLRPRSVPPASSAAFETTAVLALVSLARLSGMPALAQPPRVLDVLKASFELDARTLRYIGKVMTSPFDPDALHAESLFNTLKQSCLTVPALRIKIVRCLSQLAHTDEGRLDRAGARVVSELAGRLDISEADITDIIGPFADLDDADDPYAILGLSPMASPDIVASTYRRLIAETHPDKLRARLSGLALAQAEARATQINSAYYRIKKARGQ